MPIQVNPFTFIFSLFGWYVLPRGDEIWIGSLIEVLAPLGFSPEAVRVHVSRMKGKGYLQNRRQGRRSYYRLTPRGEQEVRWGGKKIITPPAVDWDGRWTVITYTIPERVRSRRRALREELAWWGFGCLNPGVWISPHPLPEQAEAAWDELEVRPYLEVFRAEHLGPAEPHALTTRSWPQLAEIAKHYWGYMDRYQQVPQRFEMGLLDDKSCFAMRLRSAVDFVAINLVDPLLPTALLPDDWPRPAAQSLHKQLLRSLQQPSNRFFESIYQAEENGN